MKKYIVLVTLILLMNSIPSIHSICNYDNCFIQYDEGSGED